MVLVRLLCVFSPEQTWLPLCSPISWGELRLKTTTIIGENINKEKSNVVVLVHIPIPNVLLYSSFFLTVLKSTSTQNPLNNNYSIFFIVRV